MGMRIPLGVFRRQELSKPDRFDRTLRVLMLKGTQIPPQNIATRAFSNPRHLQIEHQLKLPCTEGMAAGATANQFL
jgi:hypothetical protein